jgi:hypothetical protein
MGKPMEGAFQAMNTPLREDLIDKVWYILIWDVSGLFGLENLL